ncbi:hypothetical protein PILCRDRAFT_14899 [Piloderma croceum F 1598]|uniref:Uncharacterized protein n=1 Tax=Piloderma croceum (strain F 1598) TaxID=765440 RepID=A0A0C3AJ05_PILCF|nr:hypothetical protein PILCRDRAFT_14899 [Piloderma croceum F 1598]
MPQTLFVHHFPVDKEIQIYINRVINFVDLVTEDDWATNCLQLMLTYWARIEHEQEAAWQAKQETAYQATEERFNEERRIASEERHCIIRRQLEVDKLEQEKQQQLWKQECNQACAQCTQESQLLSPTLSHMITKWKSRLSIGESGSSSEVEKLVAPKGLQGKGLRKGKGKAAVSGELKDLPNLPAGLFSAVDLCKCCAGLTPPYCCFIIANSCICIKCEANKRKCMFPGAANLQVQIAELSAQAGPLTPWPRQLTTPSAPLGSQRQLEPSPVQVCQEITMLAEVFYHLQSDFSKVHILLNQYNLTAILLQEVEKQLCKLTGEGSDIEYDEEGGEGEGEEDEVGDKDDDGSASPFVDKE